MGEDPHTADTTCCSLTGQTERKPRHRAVVSPSTAGITQPSWLQSHHLHPHCLLLNPCFFSFLFSQGIGWPYPFLSSQRCVCSGCRQHAPLNQELMWNPHATSIQAETPLHLFCKCASNHGVLRKQQHQCNDSEGSLCKLSVLLFVFS